MATTDDFDLTPPDRLFEASAPLIVWPSGKVSKRTEAWRVSAARRLGSMHGRHGHGDGRECRGCAHLVRKYSPSGKCFLKCELYNRDGYDGTDWQARWLACGAWTRSSAVRP